jgi:DegV family protein with EDD domain
MVKIISDTTACLSPETAQRYNIPIIPQVINIGNESYLEGVEIDTETFLARLKSSPVLPKTAAPPPELFVEEFQRLVPTGEPILCIHPSTEVSGTCRSALIAAKEFPDADIRVIDTRLIASPLGTLVELAAEWACQGIDADTIVARINELCPRCHIYFLVDTLEYLAKGGRIGGAAALVGSVLRIKPILRLNDGRVDQYERERTHKRAVSRLIEIVLEQIPRDGTAHMTVMYSGNDVSDAQELAQKLGLLVNQDDVQIAHLPPAIVTHGGPGILAVGFFSAK